MTAARDADHRTRVGRERSARTESRILEAAQRVFAERGPDAPVIDDFVQAAGIARGTFYNHFKTVEELLHATSEWTTRKTVQAIERAMTGIEGPTLRLGVGLRLFFAHAQRDPVLLENVAQILIDMAEGLEHMHENGFMHLDFKPENVLVTRNASVRLVDFALAEPIPEKPRKPSRKNPGTPAYMAPEQLLGEPISHRIDIFSYGVAAYELLTNQKPFPGDTPGEILAKRPGFVEPRQYNPDLPASLQKVILRCLERDPARRYPFIGMMVRELQAALYV